MKSFYRNLNFGRMLEQILQRWCDHNQLTNQNLSDQKLTYDFLVDLPLDDNWEHTARVDVKSYRNNGKVALEFAHNVNPTLGPAKPGWFHTSEADVFVFLNKISLQGWFLFNNEELHRFYKLNRSRWKPIKNKVSFAGQNRWQSAFRYVPIFDLKDFIVGVDLRTSKEVTP